jgi:hypothetical protein
MVKSVKKDPATGIDLYRWKILTEKEASHLSITKEAIRYFTIPTITREKK